MIRFRSLFLRVTAAVGVGVLVFLVFIALKSFDEPERRAFEVAILFGLIVMTGISVSSTARIASRAEEQAKATKVMAEQAKQQLQSALRPIVRFTQEVVIKPSGLEVDNVGPGPALNVRFWLAITFSNGTTNFYNTQGNSDQCQVRVLPSGRNLRQMGGGTWTIDVPADPLDVSEVRYIAIYENVYTNFFKSESKAEIVDGNPVTDEFRINDLSAHEVDTLKEELGF